MSVRAATLSHALPAVSVTCDNGVAILTLQRPPINALIGPMINQIVAALAELRQDTAVEAAVITGGIRNAFSSGGDLQALFSDELRECDPCEIVDLFREMQEAFCAIESFPKPLVAAINGVCIGAGLELALLCDLRVASELAFFALPELAHGIIPGLGGTQRLWRVVGLGRAKEMMMVGRRLRAEDALRWGLVQQLAPHRATLAYAVTLAREVGRKTPAAFAALKRVLREGTQMPLNAGLAYETKEFSELLVDRLGDATRRPS